MDEFGNRLSDDAIKDLFLEKPPYLNEDLCALFKLKMEMFEKNLPADIVEDEMDDEELDRLYKKHFYDYDEDEAKRQKLDEYKSKLQPERLKEIEEEFAEKPEPKPDDYSYFNNSPDEEHLIKLAKNLLRQYTYLHPEGPRYFLCLPNEHNTEKIVCTTISPFLCRRHELRTLDNCAQFVADFLEYIPLELPRIAPKILESPTYTLKERKGNSLNFSIVLCSLLISANYDAFVVHGYSTKELCERDERRKPCPDYTMKTLAEKYEEHVMGEKKVETKSSKYHQLQFESDIKGKESKYLKMKDDRKKAEEATIREEEETTAKQRQKQLDIDNDPFYGQRVHFWVLVKPGKRGMMENIFVEPTTGEQCAVNDNRYLGIEFVWNNKNFFINKQKSNGDCGKVIFDFEDNEKWDYFLPHHDADSSVNESNMEWIPMPYTWVISNYEITYDDVKSPLPYDVKETLYHCAKVQKFNPLSQPNGCVRKITVYEDEKYEVVKEIKEMFENRDDRLMWRTNDIVKKEMTEFFEEGREDGLKQHFHCFDEKKLKRVMTFYTFVRPDGLVRRTSTKEYVLDEFAGRKDYLTSRKITYFVEEEHEELEPKKEDSPEKEEEASVDNYLTPYSFESFDVLLPNMNFQKWKFQDFLQQIDPDYRHVSDSESDEDIVIDSSVEIPTEGLSEEEFETEYKLWVAGLRSKIQASDASELLPIYEELTEDTAALKARKKALKKKVSDKNAEESLESEKRGAREYRRKLKEDTVGIQKETVEPKSTSSILTDDGDEASVSTCETEEELEKRKELFRAIAKRKQKYRMQEIQPGHKLIVDVLETYDRNPSTPVEKDISRKRYMLDEGRYSIFFHPPPEHITLRGFIFTKPMVKSLYHNEVFDFTDDLYEEIQPGYVTKPFRKLYLYRELLDLMRGEAEVLKKAAAIDREILRFVEKRQREEKELKLNPKLSDTRARKEIQTLKENEFMQAVLQECKDNEKSDYLTPAFGVVGFNLPLDAERAEAAYKYIINDYIAGLEGKLDFLAEKLNRIMSEYRQKKEEYDRSTEEEDPSTETLRTLKLYLEETKTKISILLTRGKSIEEEALAGYFPLKRMMFEDSRLKPFFNSVVANSCKS